MPDVTDVLRRIDTMLALADEQLCRAHNEAIRYGTPGPCRAVSVDEHRRVCCGELAAEWLLSQKRVALPAKRVCLAHCAARLRVRLETDRIRALRVVVGL